MVNKWNEISFVQMLSNDILNMIPFVIDNFIYSIVNSKMNK